MVRHGVCLPSGLPELWVVHSVFPELQDFLFSLGLHLIFSMQFAFLGECSQG